MISLGYKPPKHRQSVFSLEHTQPTDTVAVIHHHAVYNVELKIPKNRQNKLHQAPENTDFGL